MATSTIEELFSFLTPEYISTLSPAENATYAAQVQSTMTGLNIEVLSDDLSIQAASTLIAQDDIIINQEVSTVNAALTDVSLADSAYEEASAAVVSTQNIYDEISSTNARNQVERDQLTIDISTLNAEYISASTFIDLAGAEGASTLLGLSLEENIYSLALSTFFNASTNTGVAVDAYINYSTIYISTLAESDNFSTIVQSTATVYETETTMLNINNDEYVALNIDYLNRQVLATQAENDAEVASLSISSAIVYQTLAQLTSDNLTLYSELESTNTLFPLTGTLTVQQLTYKALALTLQEKLLSTVNAISSLGMQASSLSILAREAAVAAAGISVDLYTSSINNYSTLEADASAQISSILSSQVSYLRLAENYDLQLLSTQRGMSTINLLSTQANSSIISYTSQLTAEQTALADAYLTYSTQIQLASTLTQSTIFYTSTIDAYSTIMSDAASYELNRTSARVAAESAIAAISTQIGSTLKTYAENDVLYRSKEREQHETTASADLYKSLYIISNTQIQEGEYEYKESQTRLNRIPADSTFIGYITVSNTAAQQVSTGALQTNPYGVQVSTSRSTLVAWNVSLNLFNNVLQLLSSFTPLCDNYYNTVSTHVSSVVGFGEMQEDAQLNEGLGPQVSSAAIYMSTALAAKLELQDDLEVQQRSISSAMLIADSSWTGLMSPESILQIQSTINYYTTQ